MMRWDKTLRDLRVTGGMLLGIGVPALSAGYWIISGVLLFIASVIICADLHGALHGYHDEPSTTAP